VKAQANLHPVPNGTKGHISNCRRTFVPNESFFGKNMIILWQFSAWQKTQEIAFI